MGTYVNPGNQAFRRIDGPNYVDKIGMIRLINERIGGDDSLLCISRPRRFGKSYAAKMLTAYYDCSCDSHELFDNKIIARSKSYSVHLNRYNVIYLEITSFVSSASRQGISLREVPNLIVKALHDELLSMTPEFPAKKSLNDLLIYCVEKSEGKPFVFIIDEWDAMIHEAKDDEIAQKRYLDLLREWFKNGTLTPKVVAAAYMTGILPIKKDGKQSAISEFDEYFMLDPFDFAEYVGFTEKEVMDRCVVKGMDYEEIKAWYDGYEFTGVEAVYNPYSVVSALKTGKCRSYWRKTSAAESLKNYINMDFEGLQAAVACLIAGEKLQVSVAVAAALEEIREEQYAPQYYNDEQALRAVIKYAYITAFGQYVKVGEMPSGKGIADVISIPASLSRLPAMVIELKWNKSSGGAIAQIKNRKYTAALKPFAGNILLVGINYNETTGKHACSIERI